MVDSVSIQVVRVAGADGLEVDFSTGQTLALTLPREFGLDAARGLAGDVKRVLQAVLDLGNDPETAVALMKDLHIRPFEGKTAFEMIDAGRADDVVAYLESLSAGYVG